MDRERNRREPQPVPVRLSLETEIPLKVAEEFRILATAIVTQGKQALEGQMVQFFFNGVPIGSPTQTDENGRVQYELSGITLDVKSITVEAQVVGGAARARKIILLPGTEIKKKPFDLEIKTTEKEGRYFVNATIAAEDGTGTKGIIRMLTGEGKKDFTTDEQGVAFLELEVTERQKEFRFLVLGTTIDKTLRLSGKKTKLERPKLTTQEELGRGFWKSFINGWKKRKEEERK